MSLDQGKTQSWVTVTRTGSFTDPRYGRFEITREMLLSMVSNFKANTYGQKIFIDLNHRPADGAAGEVMELAVEGNRLRALVDWTPLGVDAITQKKMIYLSAEFIENYKDNEAGNKHGPLLMGAALTVRPVIKRLDPVELSEDIGDAPLFIHPELIKSFAEEAQKIMNKHLKKLLAALAAMGLPDGAAKQLGETFTVALGESTDDDHANTLVATFEEAGKQLAEQLKANPGAPIQLSIAAGSAGLSAEDVKKLLADHDAARAEAVRKLAETRAAKVKIFSEAVGAAEGLDEATQKRLCDEVADLITEGMSDEQVRGLAALQIKGANDAAIARQLGSMGFRVQGSPRIEMGTDNTVVALQEEIDKNLGLKSEKIDPRSFVGKVLAEFDARHAFALAEEHKMLAGGTTGIADSNLPAGFQRTVIRQALQDLNILNLVNPTTDFSAGTTTEIPYETRDTSAVLNDGIVFEGQGIPGASIIQAMDTAYINAMKLALKVSNEVAYFSRNNRLINWDAYGRNMQSNTRVMRELVAKRIANELLRSSDCYGATPISAEALTAQVDGATSTFKTVNFPIVRPFQAYDLKGTAIGNPENPITFTLGGTALAEYDGSGTQAAGTYYRVTNYNLGYIQTVDQTGTPVAPANATTLVVDYSQATNVALFNLDNGATTLEDYLNGLLRAVGARKALLTSSPRFVSPDSMFMLMSPTLNDTVTNARAFVESQAVNGSTLSGKGDLQTIKGVEAFGTNAAGIDLGDERLLLGEAGLMGYTIAKPFETGAPFEAVDSLGRPTGQKVAYGEEYNAIKLPDVLRTHFTSVMAYSASGR